jgi:anti-sigma B factor antagonist
LDNPIPTVTLRLEGEMNIYRVNEIKAQLMDALDAPSSVEVDLSGVTELDAAGLQLLMLAKREGARRDKTVRFTAHSPAVVAVVDLCSLSGPFGDPIVLLSPH